MEFFIFNADKPAAASLAKKIADAKPGSIIACTVEEISEWRGPAFNKVSIEQPSPLSSLSNLAFNRIVGFAINNATKIVEGEEDYGDLQPLLDWMNEKNPSAP